MLAILDNRDARVVTFGCICNQPQVDFIMPVRLPTLPRTSRGLSVMERIRIRKRRTPSNHFEP